jgi:hypothetical protein
LSAGTGRRFKAGHKEHIQATRYNGILPTHTGYRTYIGAHKQTDNTVTLARNARNGKYFSSLEKYHKFLIMKQAIHMNEFITDNDDPIFESLYHKLSAFIHCLCTIKFYKATSTAQT